jgi:hypothetical protein
LISISGSEFVEMFVGVGAALLRAGRFDRQVLVDRPDKSGRIALLQVRCRMMAWDRLRLVPLRQVESSQGQSPVSGYLRLIGKAQEIQRGLANRRRGGQLCTAK